MDSNFERRARIIFGAMRDDHLAETAASMIEGMRDHYAGRQPLTNLGFVLDNLVVVRELMAERGLQLCDTNVTQSNSTNHAEGAQ